VLKNKRSQDFMEVLKLNLKFSLYCTKKKTRIFMTQMYGRPGEGRASREREYSAKKRRRKKGEVSVVNFNLQINQLMYGRARLLLMLLLVLLSLLLLLILSLCPKKKEMINFFLSLTATAPLFSVVSVVVGLSHRDHHRTETN